MAFGGGNNPPPVNPNALPPDWKIYYNDDGVPYYYNTQTGQTTWRHPGGGNGGW